MYHRSNRNCFSPGIVILQTTKGLWRSEILSEKMRYLRKGNPFTVWHHVGDDNSVQRISSHCVLLQLRSCAAQLTSEFLPNVIRLSNDNSANGGFPNQTLFWFRGVQGDSLADPFWREFSSNL